MDLNDIQFVFALLVAFQIKQLIGVYLLQTGWMVRGKTKSGPGYIFPLAVHVFVHAAMTLAIVMVVNKDTLHINIDAGRHRRAFHHGPHQVEPAYARPFYRHQ